MKKIKLFVLLGILFFSCQKQTGKNSLVQIRISQDPESLNTISYGNSTSLQIINLLYQSLLTVDLEDGVIKPLLAERLPLVKGVGKSSEIHYKIRESAVWDNQQPVTGFDVLASLKILKCPLVHNDRIRPLFEFIQDIKIEKGNPKKFTLITDSLTADTEFLTGDFFILPAYLIDPQNLLSHFSLPDFVNKPDSLAKLPQIKSFAQWFNSGKFSHDKAFLKGSAGYQIEDWKTGQYIKLQKKKDWWGDKVTDTAPFITARPENIVFQVIPDNATAVLALQNEQVDVYENIPVSAYQQLKANTAFTQNYALHTPATYDFTYLGINSRHPKFKDVKTRQALAHLFQTNQIIKRIQSGFAIRTIGPIIPTDQRFYNKKIKPYPYDLQKATNLLLEAGWEKTEKGWQKKIAGTWVPLTINLKYKAGNTEFENIALIFQQAAADLNIPVTIQAMEGLLLTNDLKAHNFDMFIRYLSGNAFVYNFRPIWHTESAAAGGNYTAFGTPESDQLIEQINVTKNIPAKATQLKRLQEILHEQSNIIFLYFSTDRLAIHKRFGNTKVSAIKPGYDVSAFTLRTEYSR